MKYDFILALTGGAMIGLSAVMLMTILGRVLGVSGILSQLLTGLSSDNHWRLSFILGVLTAPIAITFLSGYRPAVEITGNSGLLIAGGLLVGAGTVLGNGCTSGHGVCGLSRLSTRSVLATIIFMAAAIITVWVVNTVTGV